MELALKGKVAIVTGASKGIGRATAFCLAREGTKLSLCARGFDLLKQVADEIQKETGVETLAQKADVTVPSEIEAFVAATVERFGGVDILVNNAGRAQPGSFFEVSDEVWKDDIDVKLFQMIRMCRAVVPHMRKRGGGRIININAFIGKEPNPSYIVTSVDRAACICFSKALARELAPDKILVNSINIGSVISDQTVRSWQKNAPQMPFEEYVAKLERESGIPLGRFGRAEEVADLIAFLVSDHASYITGASIEFDGGQSRYI